MTKKFFAVLLVCMLVLMSFSACGTKDNRPGKHIGS